MIIAIAATLVACIVTLGGCIAVLWRQQVGASKRCESDGVRRDKKIEDLDKFQRNELIQMRTESTLLASNAVSMLDRARRAIERAERRHPPTADETPLVNPVNEERKHS